MKLQKQFIVLLLVFITAFTKAQDYILLKNGKEYKVKAMKKSEEITEFEKYGSNRGRVYGLATKKIFAYKYESGNIIDEKGSSLTPPEFEYEKYARRSRVNMKKGIEMTSVAGGLFAVGGGLLAFGTYRLTAYAAQHPRYDTNVMIFPMIFGAGMCVASIPLFIIGPIKMKIAKKVKKKADELRPSMSFNPVLVPGSNAFGFNAGMGFGLNF